VSRPTLPMISMIDSAAVRQQEFYTNTLDGLLRGDVEPLGESAPLPGEAKWANPNRTVGRTVKPKAKVRLFALYGMGGFNLSLKDLWMNAPDWLEVRPVELPGHHDRKDEPLPLAPGSVSCPSNFPDARLLSSAPAHVSAADDASASQPAVGSASRALAAISAGRDALVSQMVDALVPLIDAPYAISGFSNGAILAYLIALELERRGAPPPLRLLCSGRGAPHLVTLTAAEIVRFASQTDEQMIQWAELAGVLPPAAVRGPVRISPLFAPVSRSGVIGMFGVGVRQPAAEERLRDADVAATVRRDEFYYAADAPRLQACKLIALLGDDDDMWPAGPFAEAWGEVAGAPGFRAVRIAGVPHHQLMVHALVRHEIFAELAAAIVEEVKRKTSVRA
jgi:surfactin synthase thioesterase subunit